MKLVKLQNLFAKCCKACMENIVLQSLQIIVCITCGNCYHFRLKNSNNFRTQYMQIKKICKLRKAIFNIFRILQHFVTKFFNFTNLNKFFIGIYFFLPRTKISPTCKLSITQDVVVQFT
jgi:hypothetical protein